MSSIVGGMNKFELMRGELLKHLPEPHNGAALHELLDVGCRGCELRKHVGDLVTYRGADLVQNSSNSVDYLVDLEKGLPMSDRSFDFVVALDVLEHVDQLEFALDELVRVTRGSLYVMLPNLAHAIFRVRYLATARFSGKYDMAFPAGRDRHRWVTVLPQADRYFEDYAASRGLSLTTSWYLDGPRKARVARLARFARIPPSLWVWASLYELKGTRAS